MEEQSFEKRKVPSDLNISNLSGISTFDNEAYDNEFKLYASQCQIRW